MLPWDHLGRTAAPPYKSITKYREYTGGSVECSRSYLTSTDPVRMGSLIFNQQ